MAVSGKAYKAALRTWKRRRERIKSMRRNGAKLREIAAKEGMSVSRVWQICHGGAA